MGEHDRGHVHRVPPAPGVRHVIEVAADDQRAGVLPLHLDQLRARRGDAGRRHVGTGRWDLDVAVAVPLEQQIEAAFFWSGDVAVERHRASGRDLAHLIVSFAAGNVVDASYGRPSLQHSASRFCQPSVRRRRLGRRLRHDPQAKSISTSRALLHVQAAARTASILTWV